MGTLCPLYVPFRSYQQYAYSLPLSRSNAEGHLDYDKKRQLMMKEDWVFSKGKSFADYVVQYAREASGGRDRIEN